MPTPKKGPRLGGSPSHQKAILANLATSLFEHGSITTTEAKARVLRPFAERLVTKAKRGDLHNRRQVLSVIRDKSVVHTLFTEIGPRFAARPGGYTRITKIGPRKGDNAPMAVISLVEAEFTPRVRSTRSATAPAATGPSASAAGPVATGEAVSTGEPVDEQAVDGDAGVAADERLDAEDTAAAEEPRPTADADVAKSAPGGDGDSTEEPTDAEAGPAAEPADAGAEPAEAEPAEAEPADAETEADAEDEEPK